KAAYQSLKLIGVGSIPTAPIIVQCIFSSACGAAWSARHPGMVENAGSNPAALTNEVWGSWSARLLRRQENAGSSPATSTWPRRIARPTIRSGASRPGSSNSRATGCQPEGCGCESRSGRWYCDNLTGWASAQQWFIPTARQVRLLDPALTAEYANSAKRPGREPGDCLRVRLPPRLPMTAGCQRPAGKTGRVLVPIVACRLLTTRKKKSEARNPQSERNSKPESRNPKQQSGRF